MYSSSNLNLSSELYSVTNFSELVLHKLPTMPPQEAAPVRWAYYNGVRVEVTTGDITTFEASAIVNAANERLRRGGGIDGAIHRAAGDRLQEELSRNWPRGGDVGGAYTTDSYQINTTEYIIHAIGPDYNAAQRVEANNQLRSAYTNSLQRATEIQAESIALSPLGFLRFQEQ